MNLYNRWFRRSLNYAPEGGGGGGGGGSSSEGGVSDEELERQAERAAEKGRSVEKIKSLLEDNYEQREQLRQLREQMPGDDQVVLDSDQAEKLQELGALDEDSTVQAEEVKERIESGEEAEEELQRLRQREKRREVYETTGLNAEAAEDILPDEVEYETEAVETEDGEETKAFVVTDDGRTPVEEHIEETYSNPIQSALYAESGEGGSEDDESGSGSGKSVPQQTPPISGAPVAAAAGAAGTISRKQNVNR